MHYYHLMGKYSIDILAIFDTLIKNYVNLLKEIVDNTNVLMKVNNLEKIMLNLILTKNT